MILIKNFERKNMHKIIINIPVDHKFLVTKLYLLLKKTKILLFISIAIYLLIFSKDKNYNISYDKEKTLLKVVNNTKNDIKVCICTLGKNENRYINEWVEHYEKYGVDKIYLYDNNDIEGERFEDKIKDYIDKGYVEVLNWRGKLKAIIQIMNNCYQNNYDKYDWIIFFEIEEFINLHNYTNIKQFLYEEKFNNCQIINLNLVLHTDNNQLHYENKPLSERFPEIVNVSKAYFEVKSILRGHIPNIRIECIHEINKHYKNCDGYGNPSKLDGAFAVEPDYTNYYIDHYYSKSTEEFIDKINRGDPFFNTENYKMERIEKLSKQIILTKEKIEMIENGTGLSLSKYK